MLTANVGHGHCAAGSGNAVLSAARASVPTAPPAKTAATIRRSGMGEPGRPSRGAYARPGLLD